MDRNALKCIKKTALGVQCSSIFAITPQLYILNIDANNDTYCLQKPIEKFPLTVICIAVYFYGSI